MIPRRAADRSGFALILALVLLALVGILGGVLVRAAASARVVAEQAQRDAQADWLVEAGLSRSRACLARDPDYPGETWTVTASEIGGRHGAKVVIRVETTGGRPDRRGVTVRAEYPAGDDPTRAARGRQIILKTGPKPSGEQL